MAKNLEIHLINDAQIKDNNYNISLIQAANNGNLDDIKQLYENVKDSMVIIIALDEAAGSGHLHCVKWLIEHKVQYTKLALFRATLFGHLNVITWLFSIKQTPVKLNWNAIKKYDKIIKGITTVDHAKNGNYEIIGLLGEKSPNLMNLAAQNGYLDILKLLYLNGYDCTASAIDYAASNGHLNVIKWLISKRKKFTSNAMIWAAGSGHLEVVQWFYKVKRYTPNVIDLAAINGHLNVVIWLHEQGKQCTINTMDRVAGNGHLEVLIWLHEHSGQFTTEAMYRAALCGNLEVLIWLHEHGGQCTTEAMNYAAEDGNLEIVKWLHINKPEKCNITQALSLAIECEQEIIINYLLQFIKPNIIPSTGEDCSVCLIATGEIACYKCKNPFHINCVKDWIYEHSSCPICKVEMIIY